MNQLQKAVCSSPPPPGAPSCLLWMSTARRQRRADARPSSLDTDFWRPSYALASVTWPAPNPAFEVARHRQILESGGVVPNETRGFDQLTGQTYSLRSKEEVKDYRYMPDGNLPVLRPDPVRPTPPHSLPLPPCPLVSSTPAEPPAHSLPLFARSPARPDQAYLRLLQSSLPELPYPATLRLVRSYPGLTPEAAQLLLTLDPETFAGIDFFEAACAWAGVGPRAADGEERGARLPPPAPQEQQEQPRQQQQQDGRRWTAKALANWTTNYVAGALAKEGKTWDSPGAVTPIELAELVNLVDRGKITRPFRRTPNPFLPPLARVADL